MSNQTLSAPYHLPAGQSLASIQLFGTENRILAGVAETAGKFSQLEVIAAPNTGPVPHVHLYEDETFFVLEGEFEFTVEDKTIYGYPGDYVFAPRNVPHTWRNCGRSDARMLVMVTPGGLENFFAEAREIFEVDPTNFGAIVELGQRYGIRLASMDEA